MTLQQLRYAVTIAESPSMNEAAKQLFISQPSLSGAIRDLEKEIGISISTRQQLEKVVAALEKGIDALAFSSGMAAITALMEIFKPGDHLITDADLYGGSIRLFHNINEKNGITFSHINCSREDVESYVNENTKAIYIETPTNPMMNVVDIRKMVTIAKKYNLLLIVDNTFMSPYFQNPLELGKELVIRQSINRMSHLKVLKAAAIR